MESAEYLYVVNGSVRDSFTKEGRTYKEDTTPHLSLTPYTIRRTKKGLLLEGFTPLKEFKIHKKFEADTFEYKVKIEGNYLNTNFDLTDDIIEEIRLTPGISKLGVVVNRYVVEIFVGMLFDVEKVESNILAVLNK